MADITSYVARYCDDQRSFWRAKAHVTALRSFLRFLHTNGTISSNLAPGVPGVAGWRVSQLPRALPRKHVEALLECHDTDTVTGLRDRAMLTLLAVLGLCGAKAAVLGLDDIDWYAGLVTVVGKGSRSEQLPLSTAVGQAMADYLLKGRPSDNGCSTLLLTSRHPYRRLTPSAVRAITGRPASGSASTTPARTDFGIPWPPICCRPVRLCPTSAKSCGIAASSPAPFTPRLTTPICRNWSVPGRETPRVRRRRNDHPLRVRAEAYLAMRRSLGQAYELRNDTDELHRPSRIAERTGDYDRMGHCLGQGNSRILRARSGGHAVCWSPGFSPCTCGF